MPPISPAGCVSVSMLRAVRPLLIAATICSTVVVSEGENDQTYLPSESGLAPARSKRIVRPLAVSLVLPMLSTWMVVVADDRFAYCKASTADFSSGAIRKVAEPDAFESIPVIGRSVTVHTFESSAEPGAAARAANETIPKRSATVIDAVLRTDVLFAKAIGKM